jgi:formate dehydrogenase maturation protein FdhE
MAKCPKCGRNIDIAGWDVEETTSQGEKVRVMTCGQCQSVLGILP